MTHKITLNSRDIQVLLFALSIRRFNIATLKSKMRRQGEYPDGHPKQAVAARKQNIDLC